MTNVNKERLAGMVLDRRDVNAFHELVVEIEGLLDCGNTCAVSLYYRLKVIRRAIAGMIEDRKDSERLAAIAQAYAALLREGVNSDAVCSELVANLNQIDRGDFQNRRAMTSRDVLELHVRKQRNGPLDTLHLDFDLHTGRISEHREETF